MITPPNTFSNISLQKMLLIGTLSIAAIGTVQLYDSYYAKQPVVGHAHHGKIKAFNLPIMFEVNKGQVASEVNFLARTNSYTMFFTPNTMVFDFRKEETKKGNKQATTANNVLNFHFVGANPHPTITGEKALQAKTNYFIGNDPKKWQHNISNFARINYKSIYPGIDMVFYGQNNQLEYDIRVAPGADPNLAHFKFDGAKNINIDAKGNLIVATLGDDKLQMHKPVIYQMINGKKHSVTGDFVLSAQNEVSFKLGNYDKSKTLVIDPALVYSSYFGGSEDNAGLAITCDRFSDPSTYFTGYTKSTDFPTFNPYQATHTGTGRNAFVTKISGDGTAIIYSTYLGGTGGNDEGFAIAVDGVGAAYIGGETNSSDFPLENPFQSTNNGARDFSGFVTKLTPQGDQLVYSTYLGGTGDNQEVNGIAVDQFGFAYVTGETTSTDFPLRFPFQDTNKGAGAGAGFTAYVTKFNTAGNGLIFSTYLGGSGGQDEGNAIAVDSDRNIFITGETNSKDFPILNALQSIPGPVGAGRTGFVTRFNTSGLTLFFSTYWGGSGGNDYPLGLALGPNENIVVVGYTNSTNFPVLNAYQSTNHAAGVGRGFNGFISKFNHDGNLVMYSTYLGGSGGNDRINGVAVNRLAQAHIVGQSNSTDLPVFNAIQSTNNGPGTTGVGGRFATDGVPIDVTYFGGSGGMDIGWAIAADGDLNSLATGQTNSTDFPLLNPIQSTHPANQMAILIKVSP